jgi:hypothetical protein
MDRDKVAAFFRLLQEPDGMLEAKDVFPGFVFWICRFLIALS